MIHADTEGLLDRCHCGVVAGFEYLEGSKMRARCTDCCEQTEPSTNISVVVVEWNMTQRERKELDK